MPGKNAFVTLLVGDSYAVGVLVLAAALKHHRTAHEIGCIVTENVSETTLATVQNAVDFVERVPVICSNDTTNLAALGRTDLGVTFSKINAWRLTRYSRVCFMDADTIVLRNVDELLDDNGPYEPFAAAPDIGWPDMFNSGVFVFRPSEEDFDRLRIMAANQGSFDGGDQGLLNQFFNQWSRSSPSHRLPFIYNVTPSATYSYVPAYRVFREDIAIIHFIGAKKPWHCRRLSNGDFIDLDNLYQTEAVKAWWDIYDRYVGWEVGHLTSGCEFGGIPGPLFGHFGGGEPSSTISGPSDFEHYHVDWNEEDIDIVPRSAGSTQDLGPRAPVRLNVEDPDDSEDVTSGLATVSGPYPRKGNKACRK